MTARLGPTVYRALDGSDYAAIVTMINEDGTVQVTTFPPGSMPTFLTRIKFDRKADVSTAKKGTCFP
jgi:hypothetical protein